MKELIEKLFALRSQHDLSGFYSIDLWCVVGNSKITLHGMDNEPNRAFVKWLGVNGEIKGPHARFENNGILVYIDVEVPKEVPVAVGPDMVAI